MITLTGGPLPAAVALAGWAAAAFGTSTSPHSTTGFAWTFTTTQLPRRRLGEKEATAPSSEKSHAPPSFASVKLSSPNRRRSELTGLFMSASSAEASTVPTLEAILWDMDGVLADTERDGHRPSFNRVFEENNLDTCWDVDRYGVLLEVGGGKERMTAHWNEVGWPPALPDDGSRQDRVKQFHLRKTEIFMDMIKGGTIPLRPGVLRLVDDAISANIKLAVCSTSNEQAVTNLVRTLMGPDRASRFRIFAGDMVARKKPAPDVYLMAIREMDLDKSRCVIVEDSGIGLKAAIGAGVRCVVTKSSYTAGEDFTGADLVVDELGDDPATGVTLETLASLLQQSERPVRPSPVS